MSVESTGNVTCLDFKMLFQKPKRKHEGLMAQILTVNSDVLRGFEFLILRKRAFVKACVFFADQS